MLTLRNTSLLFALFFFELGTNLSLRRQCSNMHFVAHFCQLNLFLTLAEARFLFIGKFVVTERATYANHILWRLLIFFGNWMSAAMALIVNTFLQTVVNRNAIIKNKTL